MPDIKSVKHLVLLSVFVILRTQISELGFLFLLTAIEGVLPRCKFKHYVWVCVHPKRTLADTKDYSKHLLSSDTPCTLVPQLICLMLDHRIPALFTSLTDAAFTPGTCETLCKPSSL